MTSLFHLSPAFETSHALLSSYLEQHTLYQDVLNKTLRELEEEYTGATQILNVLLEAQRLIMLHESGLHENIVFFQFYQLNSLQSWSDYPTPPVADDLISSLAEKMYNLNPAKNDYAMIQTDEGVSAIVEEVVERLVKQGDKWNITFKDHLFKARLFDSITDEGLEHVADYTLSLWEPVTTRIAIVPGLPPTDLPDIDKDKETRFQKMTETISNKIRSGEIHFTLTCIPTMRDAEFDNIPYPDYLTLFFEMCDQPWEHINTAHQFLIGKLDSGKTLRFTNEDGTDLSMSIDGMTFANSIIARNVPGSEVFSAPVKDSVNGKVVAKGHFSPAGLYRGERVEDITLIFKDGKCIDADARIGKDILMKMIGTDEGSCYVGEIGIGTNPHLKQRVANILLVEKISGSFHIALGAAYSSKEYMGVPVNIDNGNHSQIHWDITTLLYGKKGCIYLDDTLLMKNGLYLAPELEVLNKGWACIPDTDRPDYWKDYKFNTL